MSPSAGVPDVPGLEQIEQIGRGAFSTVYRCYQPRFSRHVALKVLDVDLRDDKARKRFENECQRLGQLTGHPSIVTVLDSGVLSGRQPYLVMQFMEGGSLDEVVQRDGPLEISEVLRVGVKVAGALETAHQAGIVHRDVKPSNVLVSRFGEPALADFGISAVADEMLRASFSNFHTPAHAAPEVLEGEVAGVPADIYSLCSTLYELLAGHYPFELSDTTTTGNVYALRRRVLEARVPPINRGDLPGAFMDVLRRGLGKTPEERPQDCTVLAAQLREVERSLGVDETAFVAPTSAGPGLDAPDLGGAPAVDEVEEPKGRAQAWIPSPRRKRPLAAPPASPPIVEEPPADDGLTDEEAPHPVAVPVDDLLLRQEVVAVVETPVEESGTSEDDDPSFGTAASWIPDLAGNRGRDSTRSGRASGTRSSRGSGSRSSRGSGKRSSRGSGPRYGAPGGKPTARAGSSRSVRRVVAISIAVVLVGGAAAAALLAPSGSDSPTTSRKLRQSDRLDPSDVVLQNAVGVTTLTWVAPDDSTLDEYVAVYGQRRAGDRGSVRCDQGLTVGGRSVFGPVSCDPVATVGTATFTDDELRALAGGTTDDLVCVGVLVFDRVDRRFGEKLAEQAVDFASAAPAVGVCAS